MNPAGAQCVNVWNEYRRMLGLSTVNGNAADLARTGVPNTWWAPADLHVVPRAGDFVLWRGGEFSELGHIALVLDSERWPHTLLFEQDVPTGAGCVTVGRTVTGHLGVLLTT